MNVFAEETENTEETEMSETSLEVEDPEVSDPEPSETIAPEETENDPAEAEGEIEETEEVEETDSVRDGEEEKAEVSLILSPLEAHLHVGETQAFLAEITGADEGTEIIWTSDHPEILSVDAEGMATALQKGSASVRAALADGSVYAEASVTIQEKIPGQIEFAESSYEVMEGDTVTVSYELTGGKFSDIHWTVSDPSVIEISTDKEGEVSIKGLQSGVAEVQAEIDGILSLFGVVVLAKTKEYQEEYTSLASGSTITGYYSVRFGQSEARSLAEQVNNYRLNSAHMSTLVYDYRIEEYAMQLAAESVLDFSATRPDGSAWYSVFDYSIYGYHTSTNLNENLFAGNGGSLGTATLAFNKIMSDNTLRSNSLRARNRSFGIGHVIYDETDYWVMLFSDNAVSTSQTSPIDGTDDVSVRIRSGLYSSPSFHASKSVLKVNVNKKAAVPSVTGTVKVKLGGNRTDINFSGYTNSWALDHVGVKYAELIREGNTRKVAAGPLPNNDEVAYLIDTVSFNGSHYDVKVQLRVIQPVERVEVSPQSIEIYAGDTFRLTARVYPDNATDKSVSWTSSNTAIASVNSQGLVTGKKGGRNKITVITKDGGFKASCDVTVKIRAEGLAFEIDELTMTPGLTDRLVPVFTPKNTTDQRVTFTSSDSTKVEVVNNGTYGTVNAKKLTDDTPVIITMTSVDNPSLSAELPVTVKDKGKVSRPVGSYLYDSEYEFPMFEYEPDDEMINYIIKGDLISLHTSTSDARLYYTLDGSTPSSSSKRYTGPFKFNGGSVTLKVIAVGPDTMKNSDVAEYRIEEDDVPTWDILDEDLEEALQKYGQIPNGLWGAGFGKPQTYTGTKIVFPEFRVYYRHRRLTINQDYKVSYKNNVNVSAVNPSVIITGAGNYTGKTTVPFEIQPLPINEENGFSYESELYLVLSKKALKPSPVILWNGKKLKNNTDYVVSYSRNREGTDIISEITEPGEYYGIITGVKNFTSEEATRLSVPIHVERDVELLSKATMKIADVEYTGQPIDPDQLAITVKSGKKVLEKGTDYVVLPLDPEECTEIGTVSLTIRAVDGSEYMGEKTGTFRITGKSLSKAKIFCLGNAVTYTGTTFTLKDLFVSNPSRPDLKTVTLYDGNEKLTEGVDYEAEVNGQNNGKGTVRFVGKGRYTGTLSKGFTIRKRNIAPSDLVIYVFDTYYSKTGARPDVYVFLKTDKDHGYEIDEGVYGIYLEENEDYTLKITNNKNVYTDEDFRTPKPPTVTITMKGNYSGKAAEYFLIQQGDLSELTITAEDLAYAAKNKGAKNYVKPVITGADGKTLTLNKDFTVNYYYAQDAKVNGSDTFNRAYGTEIRDTDVPDAGTVIAVEATGIGSYYGTLKTEYRIVDKTSRISSSTVRVDYRNGKKNYFEYTGAQIIPSEENLSVTLKKVPLRYGVDYEIQSITNNIRAGKATMVIHGIGIYGGTKKVTFNIGKQPMNIIDILRIALGLSF